MRLRGSGCCPSKHGVAADSRPVHLAPDLSAHSSPDVYHVSLAVAASQQRAKDTVLAEAECAGSWAKHKGTELEALLAADSALGDSPVALVDARYLVALAKAGGLLRRRQDLPPEAFIDLEHLKRMPIGWGALRVICVSHPWLQPDTPDPKGSTLALLARVLDTFLRFTGNGSCTWSVFLDFCSLHQKDADGHRTDAECSLFSAALHRLSDLYSHPRTFLLKVSALPPGYPDGFTFPPGVVANTANYYGRGWCFCESSMGCLVKQSDHVVDLAYLASKRAKVDFDLGALIAQCRATRPPPLPPAEFAAELETKSFTSKKADLATVSKLYESAFEARVGRAEKLGFGNLGWGDAEVLVLSRALFYAHTLVSLDLGHDCALGAAGIAALADSLRDGAAPRLKSLRALFKSRARCAMAKAALEGARAGLEVTVSQDWYQQSA
jgi:hypothetical protein